MRRSQNVQVVKHKSATEIFIEQKIQEAAKSGRLDLRGIKLGEIGVKALVKGLEADRCLNITALYFGVKKNNANSLEAFAIERSDKHSPSLLKMFNFERNDISKEAIEIFAAIQRSKNLKNITELHFNNCEISNEGIDFLANVLRSKLYPDLAVIDIAGCEIKDMNFGVLMEALRSQTYPNLTTLNFEDNKLGIESAKTLARLLESKTSPNLKKLNLDNNNIGPIGIKIISEELRKEHQHLSELHLSRNHIEPEGLRAICNILKQGFLPKLIKLNLEGNLLGDEGAKILSEFIKSGGALNFTMLDFGANQFSVEGAKILGSALSFETCPKLTAIDFSGNNPPGGKVTESFFTALPPKPYHSITELYLRSGGLGDEGAKSLAAILKAGVFPNLRKLYLGYNVIRTEGVKAVAAALKKGVCKNLTVLDFACDEIGVDGMKAIAEVLEVKACPRLAVLHFNDANIGNEGVKALTLTMQSGACQNLIALDLNGNQISADGIKAFAQAMQSGACQNLEALDISRNHFGDEILKMLLDILRSEACPNLIELALPQDIYFKAYKEIEEIKDLITQQRARIVTQIQEKEVLKELELSLEKESETMVAAERLKGDLFYGKILDLMTKGESGIMEAEQEVLKSLGIYQHQRISMSSESVSYYNVVGDFLSNHKMTDRALKYYKAANNSIKVSRCYKELSQKEAANPELLIEKGDYFLSIGRIDKAIGCYNDALGIAVNNEQKIMICDKIIKAPETQKQSMELYSYKKTTGEFYDNTSITQEQCQEDIKALGTFFTNDIE